MIDTTPVTTDTKSFSGNYLVWRKVGDKLRKGAPGARSSGGNPKFRHASFTAAETEAKRLAGLFPLSTFVILHEVARVKALEAVNPELEVVPSNG